MSFKHDKISWFDSAFMPLSFATTVGSQNTVEIGMPFDLSLSRDPFHNQKSFEIIFFSSSVSSVLFICYLVKLEWPLFLTRALFDSLFTVAEWRTVFQLTKHIFNGVGKSIYVTPLNYHICVKNNYSPIKSVILHPSWLLKSKQNNLPPPPKG